QPQGTCVRLQDTQECFAKTAAECGQDPICALDERFEPIVPVQTEGGENETADLEDDNASVEQSAQQPDAFCYYKGSRAVEEKDQQAAQQDKKLQEESEQLKRESAKLKKLQAENEHLHNACVPKLSPEAYAKSLIVDSNGKLLSNAKTQQSQCEAKIGDEQLFEYTKAVKEDCVVNTDVTKGKTGNALCALLGVRNNGNAANNQNTCKTLLSVETGYHTICTWHGYVAAGGGGGGVVGAGPCEATGRMPADLDTHCKDLLDLSKSGQPFEQDPQRACEARSIIAKTHATTSHQTGQHLCNYVKQDHPTCDVKDANKAFETMQTVCSQHNDDKDACVKTPFCKHKVRKPTKPKAKTGK
ncbi:MAG: hypothetical protein AAF320_04555, partial [Myxococcota bacterium]